MPIVSETGLVLFAPEICGEGKVTEVKLEDHQSTMISTPPASLTVAILEPTNSFSVLERSLIFLKIILSIKTAWEALERSLKEGVVAVSSFGVLGVAPFCSFCHLF